MPTFDNDEIAAMLESAGALPAGLDIAAMYPPERDEAIRDLYQNPAELEPWTHPRYNAATERVELSPPIDNDEGESKP